MLSRKMRSMQFPSVWATVAFVTLGCGSNSGDGAGAGGSAGTGGAGKCSVSALSCGDVLPAATLTGLQPDVTSYSESGRLPCQFKLPSSSGGIFQVFCGDETLLAEQLSVADGTYPGNAIETDTVGQKSFELIVGAPMAVGSFAEVNALTTNGKYVFNASLSSKAADIAATRELAAAIDSSLSGQ